MTAPKWLQDYYGNEIGAFNPEVVVDGRKHAIVKISRAGTKKAFYSSIGYVLLRKGGRHGASGHLSLHEGMANQQDLDRMLIALKKADE